MKLFKRLLLLCSLVLLAGGAWGYYHGLRPDNVKTFMSNLISGHTNDADTTSTGQVKNKRKKGLIPAFKDKNATSADLQPVPPNPFSKIDKHARNCPESWEGSIDSIAIYLQEGARSDLEKARAIYIWLTDNIKYDDAGYNSGDYSDTGARAVLSTRKSVCDGFSNLFLALGEEMGLDIKKVTGYAKGYGYTPGMKFKDTDHAWNIIKIDNNWRIFDATWGQGFGENINGKLVSKNEFDEYWFNVDPYEAIFSHLPGNNEPAYVAPAPSLKMFEAIPDINETYFQLGFNGKETYNKVYSTRKFVFPGCYKVQTPIKMHLAPDQKALNINMPYSFEFYMPRGLSMALIDAENNWTYFDKRKGVFKLDYIPTTQGDLQVCVQYDKGGESYHTILEYSVNQ